MEFGIFNVLETLGKELADSGDLLLVVDGKVLDRAGGTRRLAFFVGGVCYNPKAGTTTIFISPPN